MSATPKGRPLPLPVQKWLMAQAKELTWAGASRSIGIGFQVVQRAARGGGVRQATHNLVRRAHADATGVEYVPLDAGPELFEPSPGGEDEFVTRPRQTRPDVYEPSHRTDWDA